MSESIVYECVRCGGTMTASNLEDRGGDNKCIHCGYRVLKKTNAPFVKKVKAV